MAESEEELKSLLMRMEESERAGLRLNIKKKKKKTNIMATDPITTWQIEGEKVEVVADFIFLGSKITADGDCSHENRRQSLLESDDKPKQCVEKQKRYCANKVCIVKPMVFRVIMYSCESWTLKNAECQRIDAFKLWC